jgi:hypothetical protein
MTIKIILVQCYHEKIQHIALVCDPTLYMTSTSLNHQVHGKQGNSEKLSQSRGTSRV